MIDAQSSTSTRPYLIRALYEWCTDSGFTPYVAVLVDETVQVPKEYVKDGEIVLNISFDATSSLKLGNEFIEFSARFGGTARQIMVPVDRVIAIYARENGQGMAFPLPVAAAKHPESKDVGAPDPDQARGPDGDVKLLKLTTPQTDPVEPAPDTPRPGSKARPTLTRIK